MLTLPPGTEPQITVNQQAHMELCARTNIPERECSHGLQAQVLGPPSKYPNVLLSYSNIPCLCFISFSWNLRIC